jgi:fimbrial chaperone protein
MGFARAVTRAAALSAAALWLIPGPALAGSIQVRPIRFSVAHARPIGSVTVSNAADEPVSVRVVTLRWTQRNGEEVYEPTDDLLASPPIFTIPAGKSQLVRVGLRKVSGDAEAAYRVILEEIPQATASDGGIRIALRLNLPFYKEPKARGAARVRWTAAYSQEGRLTVQAANGGSVHDQINRIDAIDVAGKRVTLVDTASVLLPGSSKSWTVPAPRAAKLIVVKPGGEEEHALAVPDPS